MGKIHDDLSDYSAAFKYFKEANYIQEINTDYSIEYDKKLFLQIKSFFSKSLFHNNNQFIKSKNKECAPIFIRNAKIWKHSQLNKYCQTIQKFFLVEKLIRSIL